jgi:cobalamin biosynthesis Co2+ chelatase CbiK
MEEEIKEIRQIALENKKAIQEHTENIKESFEKIEQNSFVLDIIKDYKNEIDTLKDIVKTNKKTIKIMLGILIFMLILLGVVCYHHLIIV